MRGGYVPGTDVQDGLADCITGSLAMRILFTSLFLIAFPSFALAGADCTQDDSRYEDLGCAAKMLDTADKELDEAYSALLQKLNQDGKEKLKASQHAWVLFRDADTALAYQNSGEGGSLGALISTNHRIDLARVRTGQLKYLLHGPIESTRAVWDCTVDRATWSMAGGRSTLSTAPTRLKTSEVTLLATRAAEKRGFYSAGYRQASICFDASEKQWTVFFQGCTLVPGNHFSILVKDSTGATEFMRGE